MSFNPDSRPDATPAEQNVKSTAAIAQEKAASLAEAVKTSKVGTWILINPNF